MMKFRGVFTASAVLLTAVFAAGYAVLSSEEAIQPSQVLTWDCEFPAYKPDYMTIYCGDGGALINKIKWKSWSKKGATGVAEYSKNLCDPNCADGKIVNAQVNVWLSNLTHWNGKYYLRTLDMRSINGKNFPWGESGSFTWDVAEFAESMSRNEIIE
jgi:hypothetical protein